jgi:hypothetical protein
MLRMNTVWNTCIMEHGHYNKIIKKNCLLQKRNDIRTENVLGSIFLKPPEQISSD